MNLIIEKNDANGNPVEITTPYLNVPFGLPPPVNIAGYDPVQQKGATLTLAKGTNNHERVFRFKKYNYGNVGTYLNISEKSMLELSASSISAERAHIIFESYCNMYVEEKGIVLMRSNSMISLTGNSFTRLMPNSWLTQHTGSEIEIRDNATLMNCGAKFFVLAPIIHLYNNGRYIISNTCPLASSEPYSSEVDSGGSITLSDRAILTIEGSNKMIFDGSESFLKVEPGTNVIFGAGASIEFRNGAYLDADGCTFTSSNAGEIWNGIVLDGAGSQTNIRNCTFNDAATSIEVTNTVCSITGNTFNIANNSSCHYGISAVNESNITIAGNTFNAGSNNSAECIKFFNYDGDGLPGGGGVPVYYLNVFNNTFNGGVYAVDIQCLTASQLPFYISYNTINPAMGITYAGIFAYNISGNIKNNIFTNSYSNKAISLQFSAINVYNNTLYSTYQDIWSNNSSIMQMSPLQNEQGQWVWYGGYNDIISDAGYNVEFRSYSNPIISPNGNNCFTSYIAMPNFLGEICLGSKPYKAYDNYWNPSVSGSSFDITCNNNPVNVTY